MKKILSIILLISVLAISCEKESVDELQNSSEKIVDLLSYSFDAVQKEDGAVKSGNVLDSINTEESKVLSVDTWKEGDEFYMASLIEEDAPAETKAVNLKVSDARVYTFYKYEGSEITQKSIGTRDRTITVPQDANSNYGMLFVSKANSTSTYWSFYHTTIDKSNKKITYNAKFNENLCYATFDKSTMPTSNTIAVNLTPVFSQLGISVPIGVSGSTSSVSVNEVRLLGGAQQSATVNMTYNKASTSNISVSYTKTGADYEVVLGSEPTPNDEYILTGEYVNLIPNGNSVRIRIKMTTTEGVTISKDFALKDKNGNSILFKGGKRYRLKIQNVLPVSIEFTPSELIVEDTYNGTKSLTAKIKMSDGTLVSPTSGIDWSFSTQGVVSTTSISSNTINLQKLKRGATTATATYMGIKGTAKVYVAKRYTSTRDYYRWDAYAPDDTKYKNDWGGNYHLGEAGNCRGYHPGYGIVFPVASCGGKTIGHKDLKKYLGQGAYYDNIKDEKNIQPYIDPKLGELLTKGIWLKKWKYHYDNNSTDEAQVTTGRPTNIDDYFFLPLADTDYQGERGCYWTSTSLDSNKAYSLIIHPNRAYTYKSYRYQGYIPLKDFDETYESTNSSEIKIEDLVIDEQKTGIDIDLKATIIIDGEIVQPTGNVTWSINRESVVIVSNNKGTDEISVKAFKRGIATVNVSYYGLSASAKIYVAKQIKTADYYQWDAMAPYNVGNYSEGYGPGKSGYNPAIRARPINIDGQEVVNEHDLGMALGDKDGVYWDEGDEGEGSQPFIMPDGRVIAEGLWMKKAGYTGESSDRAILFKQGRPKNIENYFFIPATKCYKDGAIYGSMLGSSTYGMYWFDTGTLNYDKAQCFKFSMTQAFVEELSKDFGCMYLKRF